MTSCFLLITSYLFCYGGYLAAGEQVGLAAQIGAHRGVVAAELGEFVRHDGFADRDAHRLAALLEHLSAEHQRPADD